MPSSPGYKRDKRAGRKIKLKYQKKCPNCSVNFLGIQKQKFCTPECKGAWKYSSKNITTDIQYARISGDWYRYFQRLLCRSERKQLTVADCLVLLEKQKYKCALSGVPLTCQLVRGQRIKTNASIDRLHAGGEYVIDNVQLVCAALNSWRSDTELSEFIWWCQQVAICQEKEENDHA